MKRGSGFWLLLAGVTLVALALRLTGIDWDQGTYLHPDERFVVWVTTDLRWPQSLAEFFNSAASPLNPYNTQHGSFVYGTFPSFLVKAIAGLLDKDSYGEIYIVGRAVSAVSDTGTVVLTALIARRFFGDRAGILAGLLLACTPLFIQSAHFFTVDTISVFFTVAAFACVLRSWDRESIGWMALAGVMIGLAGASKPNYLISLAFLALPALELVRIRGWRALLPKWSDRVYPALPAALTGGFFAFLVFRLAQPYAFAGPHWWNISLNQQWLDDLAFWRAVQTGLVDMKPSIQWIDRTPVVFILENMVLWGMGLALGGTVLVALALALWRLVRIRRWPSWWMLGIAGWCVGSIAIFGTGIAQNQRYLMHIYPFLIVLAVGFLVELESRLTRAWIAQLLTAGVIVYTVVFGLAFTSIYTRPITRIEASEWIYENVPAGSVVSNEYWDDALPMPLSGEDRSAYTGMTLDLYGDESRDNSKVTTLVGQLSQVDYIVLSSNRIIDSVVRQPERYPTAVRYYEMLISGELGFEPVASFRQGPEFLGLEWDDRSAEESLTVYEHPEVRIFKKTDTYNAQFVYDELKAAWGYGGVHYIPGDPLPQQMLMTDAAIAEQDSAGAWSNQVSHGFIQQHPLLSLWVMLQIVGFAAWPLTSWVVFRNLPDMGWMLAKGIGLVLLSVLTLVLVAWFGMSLGWPAIVLALAILVLTRLATPRSDFAAFREQFKQKWRAMLAGELVFLGVFLIAALLRVYQSILPDHQLMQFTAVMRSVDLPPMDPWLSGGVLHNYWAALLPWAGIGRLLHLEPVVAYNISIVGLFAVLAGVIWSLIASIAKQWLAPATAITIVLGSSFAFAGGLAPSLIGSSFNIATITTILFAVIAIHVLMVRGQHRLVRLALLAPVVGGVIVSAEWGIYLAIPIVALGLAIEEWDRREGADPWWPIVRRFVLSLAAVLVGGIALWYPAWAAHTATKRNLISPEQWGLVTLRESVGMVLVLAVVVAVGIGAIGILAQLMEEGAPGIVVAGIAICLVGAAFVIAWKMDSALMVLMIISLLAVAAAWHWIDDAILLWSAGLILIACLLLGIAQTRQFHGDLAGASNAWQLAPVAWVLLGLGVAIAAARAGVVAGRTFELPLLAGSLLVIAALLVPTIDQIRLEGWDERVSLANPVMLAAPGELEAASWLNENASGFTVLLTADGLNTSQIGTISAVTGMPTVLGSQQSERTMRPGWEGMVDQRAADVTTMYTNLANWPMISPLLQEYGVRYIVIGSEERIRFGDGIVDSADRSEADGHLRLVFESGDTRVYLVILPESASAN